MAETSKTRACPWCGETILAVAKKCKHCGEFLSDEPEAAGVEPPPPGWWWYEPDGAFYSSAHGSSVCTACPGKPVARSPRSSAKPRPTPLYPERARSKRLSQVGAKTEDGVLKCPHCGGTQFTAKRSITGKLAIGVLAPKTRVKCVACGTMFKRG